MRALENANRIGTMRGGGYCTSNPIQIQTKTQTLKEMFPG